MKLYRFAAARQSFSEDSLPFHAKSTFRFFIAALLAVGCCVPAQAQNFNPNHWDTAKIMDVIRNPHSDLTTVAAHRGIHSLAGTSQAPGVPENSLESFGLAAQQGWESIEIDVKLTSDGVPIMSHDGTWGREWCGLSPYPVSSIYDPFTPPGSYFNDYSNPAVNATSLSNTRSLTGDTWLRDSVSIVTDTSAHGCSASGVFYGVYPATLQDVYDYIKKNNIQMVVSLDLRDSVQAAAAWKVVQANTDAQGRPFSQSTIFKMPAVAFKTVTDFTNTFGPDYASVNFNPVFHTSGIVQAAVAGADDIEEGGDVLEPADATLGSEQGMIDWLNTFEDQTEAYHINIVAVEVSMKDPPPSGILSKLLTFSQTNKATGKPMTISQFNPVGEYYPNGDTTQTPEFFRAKNGTCCDTLDQYLFNNPNHTGPINPNLPYDHDDNRLSLSFLVDMGAQMITTDRPDVLRDYLASRGKRNISYMQGTGSTGSGGSGSSKTLRILPLGDSITAGFQSSTGDAYRQELQTDLTGAGNQLQFVGTQVDGTMTNPQNEGHSGWRIDQIAGIATNVLTTYRPNVVTLLIGTNDYNQNYDEANAPTRMHNLIDQIFAAAPDTAIVVAAIPRSTDANLEAGFETFNAAVQKDVAARQSSGQHITYQSTFDLDPSADKADSLHPNDNGYRKLGDDFNHGVQSAIGSGWVGTPVACADTAAGCGGGATGTGGHIAGPPGPVPPAGTSQPQGTIASGIGAPTGSIVQYADISGDGKADYVAVYPSGALNVYLSEGGTPGNWGWNPIGIIASGVGAPGSSIRLADLDGDGKADYIVVNPDSSCQAWINGGPNPAGGWIWYPYNTLCGGIGVAGSTIQFADINGDGRADYLSVDPASGAVTAYLGMGGQPGSWGWNPMGVIASGVGAPAGSQVQFADINHDGYADYLVISSVNGSVSGWLSQGGSPGNWIWNPVGQVFPGDYAPTRSHRVVLADINGDGKADYLSVDTRSGAMQAWINNGLDQTGPAAWIAQGILKNDVGKPSLSVYQFQFADLNGDGFAEFLLTPAAPGETDAYMNLGHSPWLDARYKIAGGVALSGQKTLYADIDGDGKVDYLTIDNQSGAVSAYLNGGGSGSQWIWYPQGQIAGGVGEDSLTTYVDYADINGDGKADYVVVDTKAGGALDVWLNGGAKAGGGWNWNPIGRVAAGVGLQDGDIARFADLDADGRADYILVSSTGHVSAWINGGPNPSGGYVWYPKGEIVPSNQTFGVLGAGGTILFGDVNGDGRADWINLDANGNPDVWLNNGTSQQIPAVVKPN